MDNRSLLWFLLGAAALVAAGRGGYVLVTESENKSKWLPVLTAAEQRYGMPAGLLVRQAQQESSFSSSVIDGTERSSAGALGILQLEPAYFSSVRAPVPFSDQAVQNQIYQAAQEMARLYEVFGSWTLALAAYNWGEGNLNSYLSTGSPPVPAETANYVADITGDVPAAADAVLS